MNEAEIMQQVGREGIERMVTEFYKRVPGDDIMGPMYPEHDLAGAEERLRDFLLFRLAGDQAYTEKRGHPRLRMRHMPFQIGAREAARWVQLMDDAMVAAEIPQAAAAALHEFFAQVADFLRNVPEEGGINFRPR